MCLRKRAALASRSMSAMARQPAAKSRTLTIRLGGYPTPAVKLAADDLGGGHRASRRGARPQLHLSFRKTVEMPSAQRRSVPGGWLPRLVLPALGGFAYAVV